MSPLGSVSAPRMNNLSPAPGRAGMAPAGWSAQQARAPDPPKAPAPPTVPTSGFAAASTPQATIRQAEMLLLIASNIGASPAATPALRQIAAAAYQMEIDARREMGRLRVESMSTGRQWFA